ncbi:MAG TPA: MG2 domain-containing protein, partial [Kofleriaceae bacterium]
ASIVDGVVHAEQDGRWLAFRASQDLPADASIQVTLAAGTPSAEGRNTTAQPQAFEFRTYPPLQVTKAECGWNHECRPGMPLVIQLNNPLDPDKLDDSQITISPAIPDAKIIQGGASISVLGATSPRTRYAVTIARGITDAFGQHLAGDETRSFEVGDATPTFYGAQGLVVLDPSAKQPTLDFFTTNYAQLKVQLYAVTPADFEAYGAMMRDRWNHDKPLAMPGKKVFDATVATHGGTNQLAETHVDLKPALAAGGLGHVIAVVEPTPWTEASPAPKLIAWVQSTKLAIDAHVDADSLVAYAAELDTGKHAAGVSLELRPYGTTATTDDGGLATLALTANQKGTNYLIARRGADVAFVAEDNGYWSEGGSWFRQPRDKMLAWYVTDDRKLYKPGEEVSLKGWLRTLDQGKNGDVGPVAGAVTVSYLAADSTGNQIAKGTTQVDALGGFDTKFTLPKTPNLGYAQIMFTAAGAMTGSFVHAIQVEEFRRPEFEVSAQASQGPFLVGGGGDVTVNAKYFAGGPLAGAAVTWTVTASQTSFTPPNRDDYVFGAWTPWWMTGPSGGGELADEGLFVPGRLPRSWSLASKTDATGAHVLHMDYLTVDPAMPMSVTATASVMDVNRQA